MLKTLFLDFDGVLFNSVKEAYIISNHVYANSDLFIDFDEAEFKFFSDNRYLIHDSWQYYYIIKLLKAGVADMSNEFKRYMQNRELDEESEFNIKFIEIRKMLIAEHYDFWINLDIPYPFLNEVKKIYKNNLLDIVMVSSKNKVAVETSLKKYGINIDTSKIFGKEDLYEFKNKGNFLRNYIKEKGIKESYFIEDSQENLDKCQDIEGLKLILASWGYISPSQKGYTLEETLKELGI